MPYNVLVLFYIHDQKLESTIYVVLTVVQVQTKTRLPDVFANHFAILRRKGANSNIRRFRSSTVNVGKF